jgi:hypothetical protein
MLITVDAGPIMRNFISFLRPHLERARERGEVRSRLDLDRAAEWITRMLLSLWSPVSVGVDLDDPDELRSFVATFVVQGLA